MGMKQQLCQRMLATILQGEYTVYGAQNFP